MVDTTQSIFTVTTELDNWAVGSLRYSDGKPNTANKERIYTPKISELAAELICTENAKVCLFIYDRSGSFKGVWNGSSLVKTNAYWFDTINLRNVYTKLYSKYPNFLYRLSLKLDSGLPQPTDGRKVRFYTKDTVYSTVGTYMTWAVIGASSDAGAVHGVDHPEIAWPAILARRVGNKVSNYSKYGQKLETFIKDKSGKGLSKVLADEPKELYVITLGGNDAAGSTEFGDIGDVNDSSPNTIYGFYGYIMKRLMAHAPKAKFILTTPPGCNYSGRQQQMDNCVRQIAEKFKVPYIEWESDEFMRSDVFTKHQVVGHPSKIMYGGKAMAFERLFSRCVGKNIEYFE